MMTVRLQQKKTYAILLDVTFEAPKSSNGENVFQSLGSWLCKQLARTITMRSGNRGRAILPVAIWYSVRARRLIGLE